MTKADSHALELGQRLRQAAAHRGLTQADCVRALGAPTGTIRRYFSSRRRTSDNDRLDAVAALLGVSYEWLSLGQGEPSYDRRWWSPPAESGTRKQEAEGCGPGDASVLPVSAAMQAPGGDESPDADPYLERRRALVALRDRLEEDPYLRVRDILLTYSGPPYDAWPRDEWEAEAFRERDRIEALDALWEGRPPFRPGPGPKPGPKGPKRDTLAKRGTRDGGPGLVANV
jgi:transcriptional regulator with XRE-family HTH domain